ncbi:MAG: peptidylprolyl isomerase [Syntrophobacterales bacterium]|jgi:FKBP-type peptidyl-prolyl cis-trans isomerase SlyD|nr:peptidylprolyl isomerase [Syntrophobacterales bacterium]
MKISHHKAVTVEYTLLDDDGTVLDTSKGREPLNYIHGAREVLPGFESALEGKCPADRVSFVLTPSEGYGERDEELVFSLPRERFNEIDNLREGMQFAVNGPEGGMVMTVVNMGGNEVTLDGNHPLAGNNLHFEVEVLEVRDASEGEIRESLKETGCGCMVGSPPEGGCH